jgi:hypothetical protein
MSSASSFISSHESSRGDRTIFFRYYEVGQNNLYRHNAYT